MLKILCLSRTVRVVLAKDIQLLSKVTLDKFIIYLMNDSNIDQLRVNSWDRRGGTNCRAFALHVQT